MKTEMPQSDTEMKLIESFNSIWGSAINVKVLQSQAVVPSKARGVVLKLQTAVPFKKRHVVRL